METKNYPIVIDDFNGTAKFKVHINDELNDKTYTGNFEIKCVLSGGDKIKADKMYRDLLGTNITYASQIAIDLSWAYAQFSYRTIESPEWFKNSEFLGYSLDQEVVLKIIQLYIEAETRYRDRFKKSTEAKMKEFQKDADAGKFHKDTEPENQETK
jgi:hypothetical protein